MDLDNSRNAARSEAREARRAPSTLSTTLAARGAIGGCIRPLRHPPSSQLWWRNRLENARRKPAVTGLNPLLTDGLEARQLSPCFPPVAGPGVRSRGRIVSGISASPPPRGHIPETSDGPSSTCCRPNPPQSHPRGQEVLPSSAPLRQRAGSAESHTTLANPGLIVYERDSRQAPPTRSVRAGPG